MRDLGFEGREHEEGKLSYYKYGEGETKRGREGEREVAEMINSKTGI